MVILVKTYELVYNWSLYRHWNWSELERIEPANEEWVITIK